MPDASGSVHGGFRTDPGHLSVKVEGLRPPEPVFSFEQQSQRMGSALLGAVGAHGALVLVAVLLTLFGPKPQSTQHVHEPSREIVWLVSPGPGGGGGGGGENKPEPPRKAELPGKEKITVPAVKPPDVKPAPPKPEPPPPPPEENLQIPAQTLGDSDQPLPGVVEGVSADLSVTRGPGEGPGAGGGKGGGSGPGIGEGLGPGEGGGTGGGYYRPGSGVETPRVIREVKPQYTPDAMRAKVQGTVLIQAVVMPDGTVGNVEVVRSLDQTFGLDQEALKAARQWRFVPGTRFGRPVPVLVTIELTFTLR
jgi:protein TonB